MLVRWTVLSLKSLGRPRRGSDFKIRTFHNGTRTMVLGSDSVFRTTPPSAAYPPTVPSASAFGVLRSSIACTRTFLKSSDLQALKSSAPLFVVGQILSESFNHQQVSPTYVLPLSLCLSFCRTLTTSFSLHHLLAAITSAIDEFPFRSTTQTRQTPLTQNLQSEASSEPPTAGKILETSQVSDSHAVPAVARGELVNRITPSTVKHPRCLGLGNHRTVTRLVIS